MTLLSVLQSTTDYFKKKQIENPRLNAEHLLAHSLGRKRIELYLEFERQLTDAELAPLREMVRRRGQGEPLQHLLGTVEFCGLTFRCDTRALVPRPETEELVELLKSEVKDPKSEILDIGTGSGVIALSLADAFPEATLHAVDVSADALALARENAERLGLTNRVTFFPSNLLASVNQTYDLITANLPYVPRGERETLAREVLHDPEVALFAGERGDELIRRLIETAPSHLKAGGLLALETGIDQAEALAEFAKAQNFHDVVTRRDFAGVIRFLFARYG
jgi:release factor glutamine methyltransferase